MKGCPVLETKPFETISILGVPVSALDLPLAISTLDGWIKQRASRYVCAPDVFNISSANDDERHMAALRDADMVVPDGTPLTWVGRLRGNRIIQRVCGPDLLLAACEHSVKEGWRHYFYGGAEGVAGKLVETLQKRYPGLQVAGVESPPFRPLSETESRKMITRVQESGADIMWIGLGCPKQEIWMHEHVDRIDGVILIGVGAAFDFYSGRVVRAPEWMRNHGLEWMHRFGSEPKRLWRRYCYHAPRFIILSLVETLLTAKLAEK